MIETSGAHPLDSAAGRGGAHRRREDAGSGESHRMRWDVLAGLRPQDAVKFVLDG